MGLVSSEEARLARNAYMRKWKKKNPVAVNRVNKNWKDANREEVRDQEKAGAKRRRDVLKAIDPVALRQKEREARARRSPESVQLAKENTKRWLKEHSFKTKEYQRNRHINTPGWFLVPNAKRRAKMLGMPFELKQGDFVVPERCPVLGILLDQSPDIPERRPRMNAPSLDRLVPALGYVKGNVEVVSFRANMVKNEGTAAEHEAVARYMRERGAQ